MADVGPIKKTPINSPLNIRSTASLLSNNSFRQIDPQTKTNSKTSSLVIMPVRGYLTEKSVLAIFAQRPPNFTVGRGNTSSRAAFSQACQAQANKYRVSRKTIRDIWIRKSWAGVTANFCCARAHPGNLQTNPSSPFSSSSNSGTNDDDSIDATKFIIPVNIPQPNPDSDTESCASHNERLAQRTTYLPPVNPDDFLPEDVMLDPFHEEWETRMTGIDMDSMVTAKDMDAYESVEDWDNTEWFHFPGTSTSSRSPFSPY
eukprot:2704428-Rhodomonas_salina.2